MKKLYFITLVSLHLFFVSCSSDSDEPNQGPDVIAPTLNFTIAGASTSGSGPVVLSNQIEININAQDAGGIAKVEAFIDNQKVGEDTTAPYQIIIDISGFASKIAQTAKFKDYTLKIVVTDTAGNSSSREQIINIDNELPVISQVSLESGTIINGDTNVVTFDISDNEGLRGVKTYLNNNLLTEIVDANYEINIDTQQLDDGENSLKIEAIDLAENTAIYEVIFIADNTGPEISVGNLENGQVLDEPVTFSPNISDELSDLSSLEVFWEAELIYSTQEPSNFNFTFDPENYDVGQNSLVFIAKDELGNQTEIAFQVVIERLLLVLEIPENFDPYFGGLHLFLSNTDGTLIDVQEIDPSKQVKYSFRSKEEFGIDKEFMLTVSINVANIGTYYTLANLTRKNLRKINFSSSISSEQSGIMTIDLQGFTINNLIKGYGKGHIGAVRGNSPSFDLRLFDYGSNFQLSTEEVYLISDNALEGDYRYVKLSKPLPENYNLNFEDLTQENVSSKSIDFLNSNESISLRLHGFENESNFNSNSFHEIFFRSIGTSGNYSLIEGFSNYRSEISLPNFAVQHNGEPRNEYMVPSWNIDYTYSNGNFMAEVDGQGHQVGRAIFRNSEDEPYSYSWYIVFDSQNPKSIPFPNLPEVLNQFPITDYWENNKPKFQQLGIEEFKGMQNYEEYLTNVIGPSKRYYYTYDEVNVLFSDGGGGYRDFDFIFNSDIK